MAIGLRTKKLIKAGAIGALVMLVISLVSGYFYYQYSQKKEISLRQKYEKEVNEFREWAGNNETGYALKEDVKAGTKITEEMIQVVVLPPLAAAEDLVHPINLKGDNYARVDLKAKTVLVDELLYKEEMIEKDIREGEYSFIELPSKLTNEQFVDVRIQFPNGDDYILLSKKKVKDVAGLTLWMNLDEGEILSMSSAIVDAYIEEAKIYALPYVDGYVQQSSEITYPVKPNVMELIKETPNIVNIAKLNLEKQNRERLEAGLEMLKEEERQKLRNGEAANKNQVEQREQEDKMNALNEYTQQQQDLVGGQYEEGSDE